MRLCSLFLVFLLPLGSRAATVPDLSPVKKWIARQDEFRSVSADVKQTRSLRALRNPLASSCRLWFVAPDTFRWELGDPVKTIVLRQTDSIYVISPAKKRAERHSAAAAGKKSGIQSLATMNFQLAKDFADFQRQFEVLAVEVTGTVCHLEVAPKDPQVRKMLAAIKVDFDTANGQIRVFEISTRDGSSLRNEFSNVQVNPKIDRKTFEFDFTDYQVTDAK